MDLGLVVTKNTFFLLIHFICYLYKMPRDASHLKKYRFKKGHKKDFSLSKMPYGLGLSKNAKTAPVPDFLKPATKGEVKRFSKTKKASIKKKEKEQGSSISFFKSK
jgi:hypothetical protein